MPNHCNILYITDENADPNPLNSDSGSEGPTAEELVQRYMERVSTI